MARKPRKKRIQPIPKIWEMDVAAVQAVIDRIKDKYPDSAQLHRYQAELKRRDEGKPVPEIKE